MSLTTFGVQTLLPGIVGGVLYALEGAAGLRRAPSESARLATCAYASNRSPMKIAFVFPRTRYPSGQPPLGILSLAAYVRETVPGTEIDVIDPTFARHPLEMIRERITHGRL